VIDEGRCLLDLADLGVDAEVNRARARELFAACGAEVYVRQVPTVPASGMQTAGGGAVSRAPIS
jgi:hypothetical protein